MLTKVTITGADDVTSQHQLIDLSEEFPFVEWGILISESSEGTVRFPSRKWIDRFVSHLLPGTLCSTHMCGKWVRLLLVGELDWSELPSVVVLSQRIQINTHTKRHESTIQMIENMKEKNNTEFIFQWDGVNDHLALACEDSGLDVSVLFDKSGGAGILPDAWPKPSAYHARSLDLISVGYAGGLGPDNVIKQVKRMERVCKDDFWIDMENNVRTYDNSRLDMDAVRSVLEQCKEYIELCEIEVTE